MDIQDQLPPPRRQFTPATRRNPNKHCRYHRDHGLNMDECLQLKDKIKHLIHRGCLAQFVIEHPPQPQPTKIEPTPQGDADNQPTTRTIHTISGGLSSTSTLGSQPESSPSKRARTEDVIAFIEDDLQHI